MLSESESTGASEGDQAGPALAPGVSALQPGLARSEPTELISARVRKLGLTALLLLACWALAELTGLRQQLSPDRLKAWIDQAGPAGGVGFVAAFSLGTLVQLPGVLFIGVARLAYGPWLGFIAAYFGALAAVSVSFLVVRKTGGAALAEVRWKPLRRVFSHLDQYPLGTIALLRLVMWVSPPLNYALALSSVRFKHYFFGSALGLLPPIAALVLMADRVFACTGVG